MKLIFQDNRYIALTEYSERLLPKGAGMRWDPAARRWWTKSADIAAKLAEYADESCKAQLANLRQKQEASVEASHAVSADIDVPAPPGLAYLPYQRAGIAYAMARPKTLFGDEMGLGKTIEAIGVINADESIKRVLVICPASLRINWKRELARWLIRPARILMGIGKPLAESLDSLFCSIPLNNKIGQQGFQQIQNINGASNAPNPLGLQALDSAVIDRLPLKPKTTEGCEPVNQSLMSIANSDLPSSSTRNNPTFPVNNSRHVSQIPNLSRDSKVGFISSESAEGVSVQSPKMITQSSAVHVNHASGINHSDSLISNTTKEGPQFSVSQTRGPGHIEILILNYDILAKWRQVIRSITWCVLCIDECHFAKNPKAQRTAEILGKWDKTSNSYSLAPLAAKRELWLTGTPILNRPIELQTVAGHLVPAMFGNRFGYARRYCNAYQDRFGWNFDGASHLEELQEKLRLTCMVRRLKQDVLTELPPKRRQVIELPANGAQGAVEAESAAYAAHEERVAELKARSELAKAGSEEDYKSAIENLREAARVAFTEMSRLRHETALAKLPAVIQQITDALESSPKIVIFAHHHDVVARLMDGLKEFFPVALTGEMNAESRQASIDRFQCDAACRVFIGSIHAAGMGITLTASAHVIFAELDWVPGNITQAEDRAHRIGQKDSVLVQHLVLEGSLDARMAKALVEKQDVIDRALDREGELEPVLPEPDGDRPATSSATRKEIAEAGEKMSPQQISDIHAKLRILAGMCDGARSRDGAGFNKFDARIGHSLAESQTLTARQAALGERIVRKYHQQLSASQI